MRKLKSEIDLDKKYKLSGQCDCNCNCTYGGGGGGGGGIGNGAGGYGGGYIAGFAGGAGSLTAGGAGGAGGAATGAAIGAAVAEPIKARRAPTATVASTGTSIDKMVPDAGAGISVSTLSVDTSRRGSSTEIESPTFLSHLVTVPSVTDSPRAGIVTTTPVDEAAGAT